MADDAGWPVVTQNHDYARYARSLGLRPVTRAPRAGFYLVAASGGLRLQHAAAPADDRGLVLDFIDGHVGRRLAGGYRSPLARALGLHRRPRQRVLDATCGLGRDSATLAGLGCRVHALERHPLLFALLEDARRRAAGTDWLANWTALEHADARGWLEAHADTDFDSIYIDPMFAAPRRKARPQKSLAWLAEIVGVDADAERTLAAARRHASPRTVVKRHTRAAPLAPPDRQVQAKAVRFDIYLTPPGSV